MSYIQLHCNSYTIRLVMKKYEKVKYEIHHLSSEAISMHECIFGVCQHDLPDTLFRANENLSF